MTTAPLRIDLRWGLRLVWAYVLFLVLVFAIDSALRYFGDGSVPLPFGRISILKLTLAYFVGGITSGLLLKQLWFWATARNRAVVIGSVAALPFLGMVRLSVDGASGWTPAEVFRLVAIALAVGLVTGSTVWTANPGRSG